jgi:hypothetical protein
MYAIERVLGVPEHTLQLIDRESLREWYELALENQKTGQVERIGQ